MVASSSPSRIARSVLYGQLFVRGSPEVASRECPILPVWRCVPASDKFKEPAFALAPNRLCACFAVDFGSSMLPTVLVLFPAINRIVAEWYVELSDDVWCHLSLPHTYSTKMK